jgi:hypothetical protein
MDPFASRGHRHNPSENWPPAALKLPQATPNSLSSLEDPMRSDSNSTSTTDSHATSNLSFPNLSQRGRPFAHNGNFFCSRSEAACAVLMGKYLGYYCTEEKTFQVPMGRSADGLTRHFDFLIFGAVLEYHPFHPPKDPQYWKMLRRLEPGQRSQLRALWARNDAVRYFDKRRSQLNDTKRFKNAELIVARSPEDFYEKVIVRFMKEQHIAPFRRIPSRENFVKEFRAILGEVTELKPPRGGRVRVRTVAERGRSG